MIAKLDDKKRFLIATTDFVARFNPVKEDVYSLDLSFGNNGFVWFSEIPGMDMETAMMAFNEFTIKPESEIPLGLLQLLPTKDSFIVRGEKFDKNS